MPKLESCMLLKTFDPDKHSIGGYFISEKLDGMRCLWDGIGPRYLEFTKDHTYHNKQVGRYYVTGLWSRLMKPILAPEWFIKQFPEGIPLDGELILGRGGLHDTLSVTKRTVNVNPNDWKQITFHAFDVPNLRHWEWIDPLRFTPKGLIETNTLLQEICDCRVHLRPVHQTRLPLMPTAATGAALDYADTIVEDGGEGAVVRCPFSPWAPHRVNYALKIKPYDTDEGLIVGWSEGKGKYVGMIGALRVSFQGYVFSCSGMTDAIRATDPNKLVGRRINFRYRLLSEHGLPIEPRMESFV